MKNLFLFITYKKVVARVGISKVQTARGNCVASKYSILSRTWSAAKISEVIMSSAIAANRGGADKKFVAK